jgi:hypothetical protein
MMRRAITSFILTLTILASTFGTDRTSSQPHDFFLYPGRAPEPAALLPANPNTVRFVDDGYTPAQPGWGVTHFNAIGPALAAAAPGDAISIYTGIYPEQIDITIPITLEAVAGESPVMNGNGLGSSPAVTISAPGVFISGMTLQDYTTAILVSPAGSVQITLCRIFDNGTGLTNQNITTSSSALNCWWGAPSGPLDPSDDRATGGSYNPNGLGNPVSDHVAYYPWSVNSSFTQQPVEFGLYSPDCGTLEVRLKPLTDITSTTTMLQFTVRWTTGTVSIASVSSPVFGIDLDNLITGINGFNYAVFTSDEFTPVDFTAGTELPVMTFEHDGAGSGFGDFEIVMDAWTGTNNADPYLELMGTDFSGEIYHMAENVYLDDCDNAELLVRALLEGPYDSLTNLMKTDLQPSMSLNQPYFYPPWNYYGTESISNIPAGLVDWVLVELRSTATGAAVDRTAGLLMNDGTILDASLDGAVRFDGITPSSPYYILVHHRNHLPVMSGAAVTIPNMGMWNFADTLNYPPYGTGKLALTYLENGVRGLITGDVNRDGKLTYSGPQNDRGLIINQIYYQTGSPLITQTIQGYYHEDLTMNRIVKYSGPGNDQREIILNLTELTGSTSLNTIFQCVVPGYATNAAPQQGNETDLSGPMADIGIFKYTNPDELVVKIRPDHNIPGHALTNIQFTISWQAPSNVYLVWPTANTINSTFNIQPQGPVMYADGWYHQVFAAANGTTLNWTAGTEYPVLVVKYFYSGPGCNLFEISDDIWTGNNNGVYYFEVVGQDRTGIRYHPQEHIYFAGSLVIWTGNVDSDWDDDGNWNACGVPTIDADVLIPNVSPNTFPVVTTDGYCKTLTIQSGATVTILESGSVTVGNATYSSGSQINPPIKE